MKRTATGQRRHRITVFSLQKASDGQGGFAVTEQPELTAWVRIRRLWGHETVVSGAMAGRQTIEVYLPASDAARQITADMIARDEHTGRRFNIRDVSVSDDRAEIVLLAESGVPA